MVCQTPPYLLPCLDEERKMKRRKKKEEAKRKKKKTNRRNRKKSERKRPGDRKRNVYKMKIKMRVGERKER